MNDDQQRPDWLEEFETLANERLGNGSACHQVHPIVARWYTDVLRREPPASRDSVLQAMNCLSTEIITNMPDELFEALFDEAVDYDDIALWVQDVLMLGRAFQLALDNGDLDDL